MAISEARTAANAAVLDVAGLTAEDAVPRLIDHAIALGASDLFFNADETHLSVSVRHLGILRRVCRVPSEAGRRFIALVKASAGMDIAERRRPVDGRWIFTRPGGAVVDLRISTVPTLHGEDLSMRLLDRVSRHLHMEQLGLHPRDHQLLLQLINSPSGLLLVTGPTGSGKTTTLYSLLAYLNSGERKINTIEDPVEYAVDGVRQSQVNTRLEVGFPELLRAVLRQSPDVIMIGEVRDAVTAETAVRAANSGHLVVATLHAPLAAGAIASLLNLGAHPLFLANSLLGVVAQRLVRTLCPDCKVRMDAPIPAAALADVREQLRPGQGEALFAAQGCARCRMVGYRGRTGVFEVLPRSRLVQEAILDRHSTRVIHDRAVKEGMVPFRVSAMLKVAAGETTIEEIFRAIPSELLQPDAQVGD